MLVAMTDTAMLLGAAKYLSETKNFKGKVVLIFQPAEEGFAGAKAMIDDGLLERYPINEIYGMHNMPGLEAGVLAIESGPRLAAADNFMIEIIGKGAHGAMLSNSIDPIVAVLQLFKTYSILYLEILIQKKHL